MNSVERSNARDAAETKLNVAMKTTGLPDNAVCHLANILDFVINDLGKSQAVVDYLKTMQELLRDEKKDRRRETVEYGAIMRQFGL